MFKFALSFVFAAALMASPVFAGGAKKDAIIRFTHDISGAPAVVVIGDPAAALKAKILANTATLAEITKAGGVLVRPGETKSLPVKAGNVALHGSTVNLANGDTTFAGDGIIPVAKGKRVKVLASSL